LSYIKRLSSINSWALLGKSSSEVKKILLGPEELSCIISSITTTQEAKQAYNASPEGSEAERIALEKWNSLALPLAEKSSMGFLGTFVSTGQGRGIVVETGDKTIIGSLAQDLDEIVEEATPIQWEMARISKFMLWIVVTLIIIIFFNMQYAF